MSNKPQKPEKPGSRPIPFTINVNFEGVEQDETRPEVFAYAYDAQGRFYGSSPVGDEGVARLELPSESANRAIRVLIGPPLPKGQEPPKLAELLRRGAYEKRFRFVPENARLDVTLLRPVWELLLWCRCVVRGRLIKRISLPNGTTKELPICNARVNICEVDRWPIIVWRLPDDLIYRLRDELLDLVAGPRIPRIPIPEPDPPPFVRGIGAGLGLEDITRGAPQPSFRGVEPGSLRQISARRASGSPEAQSGFFSGRLLSAQDFTSEQRSLLGRVALANTALELRRSLIDLSDLIRPFFCYWPWLDPFFLYRVDCLSTVDVDENGYFETTIYYPCFGDQPDIYISAEQLHSGGWEFIYRPSVRCYTYWNYNCGEEIVINVTDPSAIPCAPQDPVDPPPGIGTWVMPFAVGGTEIYGTAPAFPPPAPTPATGWVRPDGMTDYGSVTDAPFGGYLGFRQGYSYSIPFPGIRYYRWRFRKGTSGAWHTMDDTVVRHYVRESPGLPPAFPVYPLGPKPAGMLPDLFEFKPDAPPGPQPGDPPGTITYWPTDDTFADIYSAFMDTVAASPVIGSEPDGRPFRDAGVFQIRLEIYDGGGNQVMPGPGTFRFVVPTGVASDGTTITTREAMPSELDGGAFVFNLHIDNNRCFAEIGTPNIGGTAVADDCGFLRYDPTNSMPVTLSFEAKHHNNHATFDFDVVRGSTPVGAASASGEVDAATAGAYSGDGAGNFSEDFARGDLLDTCVNAAFAEHLHVKAKATNGWSRIDGYDDGDLEAFALAPEE